MNKRSIRVSSAVLAIVALAPIAYGQSSALSPTRGSLTTSDTTSPSKAPLTDAQILGILDAANGDEVDQGKIAEAKGHAQAVKRFGKMMIEEHTAAKEKGRGLAKALSLSLQPSSIATALKARSEDLVKELHQSNPASFDGIYIGSQVTLHQDVLALIDAHLAVDVRSSELKAFVSDIRRHVIHHLEVAKSTMKALTPKSS
jgi:putative membrane protein